MTAGRSFKKDLRKNDICSEVCIGGWKGSSGKSSAEESSDQSAGKYKPHVVASGVEVSTEWTEDLRKPEW